MQKTQHFSLMSSLVLLGVATAYWASDMPAGVRVSGPGVGYICSSTPAPFWTMTQCNCPVNAIDTDFCSERRPLDAQGEAIEFRFCEESSNAYSCNTIQLSCGDEVWNCPNAHCDTETYPIPLTWGCVKTGKPPEYCSGYTYDWCDPVEYEEW